MAKRKVKRQQDQYLFNEQEFMTYISTVIASNMLPDDKRIEIRQARVAKTNDRACFGLTFLDLDKKSGPTVWLNDLYDQYLNGVDIDMLAMQLWYRSVLPSLIGAPDSSQFIIDMTSNLSFKLVEIERNREYLAGKPYVEAGYGYAMVFIKKDLSIPNGLPTGEYVCVVTDGILEADGRSKEELYQDTIVGVWEADPPQLIPFSTMYMHRSFEKNNLLSDNFSRGRYPGENAFVLTTRDKRFGASALFYPGVIDRVANILQEDFFAVPSSVHEFYIFRDSFPFTASNHLQSLRALNDEVSDPAEILSYNILYYDFSAKSLISISEAEPDSMAS